MQKVEVVASANKRIDPIYVEKLEHRLSQAYAMNGELQAKLKSKSEVGTIVLMYSKVPSVK